MVTDTGTTHVPRTIRPIHAEGSELEQVLALYKRNTGTLGFLPRGAFEEFAQQGWVLVATGDDGLEGYLAWRVSGDHAVIVHLCVAKEHQGKGIASALLKELFHRTPGLRAIRLSCREEYEANRVWPRHGFICDREKPGRGADGARLFIWTRKHAAEELPLLATIKASAREGRKVAAVDANVFFDFEEDRALSDESRSLLADWLAAEVVIAITAELRNEITRQTDAARRDKVRARMTGFMTLEGEPEAIKVALAALSEVLPPPTTASDESDRRQLAHAMVESADFFVTRDHDLLDHADAVRREFGIRVLRPADLIVFLHEHTTQDGYTPSRLVGTVIQERRPKNEGELLPFLRFARGETKADWLPTVRKILADPRRYKTVLLEPPGERPKLAVSVDSAATEALTVVVLRALSHRLTPTLLRRRLSELLLEAVDRGLSTVRCLEVGDPLIEDALRDLGFTATGSGFMKASVRDVIGSEEASDVLSERFPEDAAIRGASPAQLESRFWPLKVVDGGIPTYLIPIQPHWASELFDARLAETQLFGAKPSLALALENVYYSASSITIPSGARILWYVSGKGRNKVGEVRATSICQETVSGTPDALFRQFRHLGIYRYRDVIDAAKGDPTRTLRAYRFALTERFPRPVPFKRVQAVLEHHVGHGNPIAGPVQVPEAVFSDIYTEGIDLVSEHAAILVSIKPDFAQAIANGTKTVELRRRFPCVHRGMSLVIYATQPVGGVVGLARIDRVEQATPDTLWAQYSGLVGIDKAAFDRYFDGCATGHAVHLSDFRPLEKLEIATMAGLVPGFRPPQSFRYLSADTLTRIAKLGAE